MTSSKEFLCGVIEGFYGRAWSFQTRLLYADYLASAGLNTYLYCPKSDMYLRKQWQQHWPLEHWQQLQQLSARCRERNINWGPGLSPFALYQHYGASERRQLKRKLDQMAELQAPLLAILFDDMPGDLDALASRQAEIVCDVIHWVPDTRVLVCPTYYSYDPVLPKYFGAMPMDYWSQLGRDMPDTVDLFWTGNRVCSEQISGADIESINRELGRRVILWDNYPVNDGAQRSNYIYSTELSGRDSQLRDLLSGHLCNPMNQGVLSLPALNGLAHLYGAPGFDDAQLAELLGEATWARLREDGPLFEVSGLTGMGAQRRRELASCYAELPGQAAQEVAGWLRGEYAFDPACLTD